MKLSEIIKLINGQQTNNSDIDIKGLAGIEDANNGDLTFLSDTAYIKHFATTNASAILLSSKIPLSNLPARKEPIQIIKTDDAYKSFMKLVEIFYPAVNFVQKGIHPTAVIDKSVQLGSEIAIGAGVVIGENCKVGNRVAIHPNTVLYPGVEIDDDSIIFANVIVRENCRIGKRVIIHSGTVIGSDGFGFIPKGDGSYEKIQQRGIVVIENDVEIGSNCSIDRATIGETRIERGVKLDNLIQIAHNVKIGADTVIAGQTGISGSTKIGKQCIIAGQVGFVGHISIADRTRIGAQSGISKSISKQGQTYFGYPAKKYKDALRIEGSLRQLPEALLELRNISKRLEEIEENLKRINLK